MRIDIEQFLALTFALGTVGAMGCATAPPPATAQPAPNAAQPPVEGATTATPDDPDPEAATQPDAQPEPEQGVPDPTVEVPNWD
jgi:hypothetical protein